MSSQTPTAKAYPEIHGIDTEAAEQIFHIANRWCSILSNSHPVHGELQLLLYGDQHNESHTCDAALQKYNVKQAVPFTLPDFEKDTGKQNGCTDMKAFQPEAKKRKKLVECFSQACSSRCNFPCTHGGNSSDKLDVAEPDSGAFEVSSTGVQPKPFDFNVVKLSDLASDAPRVVINPSTRTVHFLVCQTPNAASVRCQYTPPWGSSHVETTKLSESDYYTCGTCFGKRKLIILD